MRVRALVEEGAIGTPEHVQFSMLLSITRAPLRRYGWLFDDELGGGWLRALGSHLIDFSRWTFGEVVEASGPAADRGRASGPTPTASCTAAPPTTASSPRCAPNAASRR